MKITSIALVLTISLLASCKDKSNYEKIAEELCNCLRPVVEVYEASQNISEDDSPEDIQTAMEKMEQAGMESNTCVDALTEKYGNMENQEAEVEAAMQRVCPDIAKAMNEIESEE